MAVVAMPPVIELMPCPDPWQVARSLAHLPHLLFLDSADRHANRGRYSYVTADPVEVVTQFPPNDRPLATSVPGMPPFQGGWAGLFGYQLGGQFEAVPPPRSDEFDVPSLVLGRYEWVVSFDHANARAWIVGRAPSAIVDRIRRPDNYVTELPRFVTARAAVRDGYSLPGFPGVTSNFTRTEYETAVRRAVEYVHAGDVFQVNLSQRLLAPLKEHPLDLYCRLRERNPAPFACYFDAGDFQVLSASPERFIQVAADGSVSTTPIKGTRPRGRSSTDDAVQIHDLTSSAKDRAENVMIVDLLRNDLGRVCRYGSVIVPRVCEVETYRFVHHLVSEVRGRLRPGVGPFDLLRATFPGGSVTGAPKVRAMEIIAELEPTARGPYCGSVGWIGACGSMDTNILIRTFTAGRGWVQFPVGGGIVADSQPASEYEETLHKAAGLLRSLQP